MNSDEVYMKSIIENPGGLTFLSVILRLTAAVCAGGLLGYSRTKKSHTAGLRTYSLTALGAAMSVLIAIYEYEMMKGAWAPAVAEVGMKFDASRFASSVIGGIGFLAAGSIVALPHQQVEGLTTATGLFASVCMGIAAGAGFFSCVIVSMILIFLALEVMQPLERRFQRRIRNITFSVEFDSIESIAEITEAVKQRAAEVQEIEIEREKQEGELHPSAIFSLRMSKDNFSHSGMLSAIAELPCVYSIEELG